ncbi:MAG: hypothetical protein ABI270_07030 [Nitrosospira sp.]
MRRKENGALKRIGMMAEREIGGEIERIEATKGIKATKATKAINGAKGIRETKGTGGIRGEARMEKTTVTTVRMTMEEGTNGMATRTPGVGKVAEVINELFY